MKSERLTKAINAYIGKSEEIKVASVCKDETFDVVDVDSGDVRPINISFSIDDQNIDIDMEGNDGVYILDILWDDIWTPIIRALSLDDKIENDYINLVEKLKVIDKLVKESKIDEAKKGTVELMAMAKEIENKYNNEKEAWSMPQEHMINGKVQEHTLKELIRAGHKEAVSFILKKEGYIDETIKDFIERNEVIG